ncbi:MAG: class I SAM-dependent methyltransferase [Chitinophagaceae bacterium]|nr:class I SAM-dependent methyltransferase [Chitinophagaceae bacterium]
MCGNFDNVLPQQLQEMSSPDFVFIDGNHRLEPTLRYFDWLLQNKPQEGVYVFDDIHWSAEMEEAWDSICKHPEVFLTIDLFFIGLVFFNPSFKVKQHFSIRF